MKMACVHIVIFFTSAVCFFGIVISKYIIPSEPFHKGGFGAEPYPLPTSTLNSTENMKFRIIYRSENVFYVGGRGIFHRIDPYSATCEIASSNVQIGTCEKGGGAFPCSDVAPIDEKVDCHNYIRIVEEFSDNRLLVCGTNALEPRCYVFIFNQAECELQLEYPSGGIGTTELCTDEGSYNADELAPKNWNLNYSYWYSNDKLFAGVSKAADEKDPIWANFDVIESNIGTSTKPFISKLETYEIESRAVNEANFVGKPYEYTKDGSTFVLFFYRETAVEFINHGKIVYSRVGRVCRDDNGMGYKWTSFLKARLNCSIPALYPTYFNEIQDVAIMEGDSETYFYSVFATPSNGASTSALCQYRLSDIHNLFHTSKFKSPSTSTSLWLPVDPNTVPTPRPGSNCNNPSTDTSFIQNNPLMEDLVNNYNTHEEEDKSDAPMFYADTMGRFSTIAVDVQGDSNSIASNIYYIGTESGNVLKAYNNSGWSVFRYWQHDDKEAINNLEFIPAKRGEGPWLFAVTQNSLTKIDLKHGKAQNQEQYDTIYYPYLTDALQSSTGVIVESSPELIITCDNREINLFCEGRLDLTSDEGNITWYMNDTPVNDTGEGHLLKQTHLTGNLTLHPASFLTILALQDKTDSTYSCEVWFPNNVGNTDRRDFTIELEDCITEKAVERRQVEFDKITKEAKKRDDAYETDKICLIEEPVLCDQSCPFM